MPTHYINTDLDLASPQSLDILAAAFKSAELYCITSGQDDLGQVYQIWEVSGLIDSKEPALTIELMLEAIENLPESAKNEWESCTERVFDIGYNCGAEPWGFQQEVPSELLARMVAQKISLRLTLYPERPS